MCFHTTSAFGEGEGKKLFITQHLSVPLFIAFFCALKSCNSIYLVTFVLRFLQTFGGIGNVRGYKSKYTFLERTMKHVSAFTTVQQLLRHR